ncbi:O-antigen ligase family protein [Thalassotalea sp. 1_MG-2023]|uniref:O-antigen ligase family protein n=1 Tax=Thalassotalea sp. 1_MG-2023 TaxID=3062680 RepID=UPI0026E28873|nr:O-antigen ligase family protein [Thalassotalea sp. 1_MG-2023]MDO6425534.1 O-antigen ligase family protein [Thalassotalea sp. 1_MG-2023]
MTQTLTKVPYELLFTGGVILAFAVFNVPILLLSVVVLGIASALVLPFNRILSFTIFLLPCFEVFTRTSYLPISLVTLIYIAFFGRYLLTQITQTTFFLPGVMVLLMVVTFELLHVIYNPVMYSAKTLRWVMLFLFVALLIFDKNKYASFYELRRALLYGVIVSATYGLMFHYFHPVDYMNIDKIKRFSGGAGDPNNFGLYCLLTLFFYLPTMPKESISYKGFSIMLVMILLGSLTVSRSFFLISAVSLFLYFVFYFRSSINEVIFRLLLAFNIVAVLVAVAYLSGISMPTNLDIVKRFSSNDLSALTGARSVIFQEYVAVLINLPVIFLIFGAGINGYLGYFNHKFEQLGLFSEVVGPHNTFLELIVSFGLIGCILFFAFLHFAFYAEKIRATPTKVYRLAYLPLIVLAMYSISLQNLGKYGSYFILMLVIYHTYNRRS